MDDVSLEQVFKAIQEQSGFDFFYKTDQIPAEKRVSLDYKNLQVEVILEKVLQGTNLSFYVLDKDIVISPKREMAGLVSQQVVTLTGKVTDSSGAPLPGVTVVIKGTTSGTITEMDGNYSLSNVPSNATLVFSFVGMKTQEIPVGNKSILNVQMVKDAIGLEEVVAIGYGTQKKVNLTGSVESVDGEKLARQPVAQTSQALAGLAPGLTVIQSSGQPGKDNASLRIRGIGSIGASNDPLILIDGIEGNINRVDANNIATISVLKDAASAAIYGSRASNGVILITTKRGPKRRDDNQL